MKNKLFESNISDTVEIRAFGTLREVFQDRGWPFPIYVKLEKEVKALDLARALDLPSEKIEAVFINGSISSLQDGKVKPNDRIAFVPPGTPGPYRVMLGMVEKQ